MKKFLSIFIAALMLVTLFVGCNNQTSSSDNQIDKSGDGATTNNEETTNDNDVEPKKLSGKITFAMGNGQKLEAFQQDAKEFMEKNPGTTVEIEFVEKIETIKTRMAANELPDIAQVPQEILKSELPEHYAPIDDLGFTKDNLYFYDSGVGPDGKLYSVTSMISFNGIVYNKKVFEEAGITKIPTTMDEFYEVCETLKAKGIIPFASNFKDKWPLGMYSIDSPFTVAMTGDPEAGNKYAETDELMSGTFLEALNFLREMKERGYLEPDLMSTDWGGFTRDFGEGKIAMSFLGSWFPTQIPDEDARGMFPFPGSKNVVSAEDWHFAVAKNSKSLDLAKVYFKHLFLDGAYYDVMEVCSPIKGAEYPFNFINELVSYGIPLLEMSPTSEKLQAVKNAFAVDFGDIIQEYMLTDDTEAVIKKYNDKWAEARKAVNN